jgi:hypothetical protein
MGTRDEIEASTIRPPRRGECDQIAGTATTQVFAARASWFGKKVRFMAIGDDFWIQTAPTNAISIDPTATIAVAGGGAALPAANNAITEKISNGEWKEFDFYLGQDDFVGVRGTGTSGLLMFRPAETTLGAT